jgi:hypothetical protein
MKAVLFVLALAATPAFAQAVCPTAPSLPAGTDSAGAPMLKPGQAVMLALQPAPQVHFSVPARRAEDAKTFGGAAAIMVETAGTYRISLGSTAWIAVAQDAKEVNSTTHSHGDSCLVKMVNFPLHAGQAYIEISASPDASVRLMAAPAP